MSFCPFWQKGRTVADQEIAKHTKNILGLFRDEGHGWRHKLGEIALEVVTIVFAVSLSIWLQGLGEHRHEQEQVRQFLLGLRHDLKTDIETLSETSASYHESDARPEPDTFQDAYLRADANAFFNPLTSRYQGFKSSGKLGNIEDEELMEKLLDLYENRVKQIKYSEGGGAAHQNLFRAYLENGLEGDDDLARRYRVITAPKGKRLLRTHLASPQLYDRYNNYAAEAAEIIKAIEREYPSYVSKDAEPAPAAKGQQLSALP